MDIKLYKYPDSLIGVVGFATVQDLCDAVTNLHATLVSHGKIMVEPAYLDEAKALCNKYQFHQYLERPMRCPDKVTLNKVVKYQLDAKYLGQIYPIGGEDISEADEAFVDGNYYSRPNGEVEFRDKIYPTIEEAIKDDSNAYKGNKFGHMKLDKGAYAVMHYWDITLSDFEYRYANGIQVAGVVPGAIMDVDRTWGIIEMFRDKYLNLFGVDENHIKFDYEVIHMPDDKDKRTFIRYGLDVLQLRN